VALSIWAVEKDAVEIRFGGFKTGPPAYSPAAFARRGSLGLRPTGAMLLTSGLLCRNGNPIAGGSGFGCRCFDCAGRSRADARRLGSGRRFILDIDRFEAALRDAKSKTKKTKKAKRVARSRKKKHSAAKKSAPKKSAAKKAKPTPRKAAAPKSKAAAASKPAEVAPAPAAPRPPRPGMGSPGSSHSSASTSDSPPSMGGHHTPHSGEDDGK
jgi:hypothetical protein